MLAAALGSIYIYSSQIKKIQLLEDKYMTGKNNFSKYNLCHFGGNNYRLSELTKLW